VPVFVGGEGGHPVYRIPAATRLAHGAHAGRILAFAEGRGTMSDNGTNDIVLKTGDDGGATWSAPREVTREVKRATGATSVATGPGIGIQPSRGPHARRVIMPFNEGPYDRWRVSAAYSDDGGDSWTIGAVAPTPPKGRGNEVQMFERADGVVVLNARQHLGATRRTSAVSADGGATWTQLADVPELPDPQCMGGVFALGDRVVVFTGCDSETRRAKGSMWISRDDGASWPERVVVEPEGFAYSVPVARSCDEVGILHEGAGYTRIVFRRIAVAPAPVR
jgi:sialidase-1